MACASSPNRATYEADALVFAAGSWNSQLMPWLRGLATPELQVLIWMQPERPEYFRLDNFPVFNCLVDEGRFYGFPVFGVPGFKFGKYHHFEEQGAPGANQAGAVTGGRGRAARVCRPLLSRPPPARP